MAKKNIIKPSEEKEKKNKNKTVEKKKKKAAVVTVVAKEQLKKEEEDKETKKTMTATNTQEGMEVEKTKKEEEEEEKKEEKKEKEIVYGFPYERLSPEELKRRREDGGESSDEETKNTVGNVPMEWYEDFPHIGYDLEGKPIAKSAEWAKHKDLIEDFLDAKDDPDHWRKFYDAKNDTEVRLSDNDLRIVGAIMGAHASRGTGVAAAAGGPGGYGGSGDDQLDWPVLPVDPIAAAIPTANDQPRKRDFARQSRGEWRQTMHLVRLIQRGWINPATGASVANEAHEKKQREAAASKMYAYDLWATPGRRRAAYIPPPHEALPGHAGSYNPPAEYLPTDAELAKAEALENKYERDDALAALARKYPNLRSVPRYDRLLNDAYRRCLELYLCPRARPRRRHASRITPDTPVEDVFNQGPPPPPEELRPFPTTLSVVYKGHTGAAMVRSAAPDAAGEWLASGADNGELRLWEVATGRCVATVDFGSDAPVRAVAWCTAPGRGRLLAVAAGTRLFLIATSFLTGSRNPAALKARKLLTTPPVEGAPGYVAPADRKQTKAAVTTTTKKRSVKPRFAKGDEDNDDDEEEEDEENDEESENESEGEEGEEKKKEEEKTADNSRRKRRWFYKWRVPTPEEAALFEKAFRRPINRACNASGEVSEASEEEDLDVIVVDHPHSIALLRWHHGGDYLLAVTQLDVSQPVHDTAVVVHRLSARRSQRLHVSARAGPVQAATFHPTRPVIVVATQRTVRIYDVSANRTRSLIKKLEPNMRWVSTVAVHPSGDHVLAGSYDKRLSWFDLDYSSKPYKLIRHHKRAVRRVAFHQKLPLFASCGDDGRIQILHDTVSDELDAFPVLVPLRTLHGHTIANGFGILDIAFHPTLPWIFSAGADGLITLHTDKDVISMETKRRLEAEGAEAAAAAAEEEEGRFVVLGGDDDGDENSNSSSNNSSSANKSGKEEEEQDSEEDEEEDDDDDDEEEEEDD